MGIDPFTATIGASLIGGVFSSRSAKKQAKASQAGFDAATEERRRQFDLVRADTAQQREVGGNALGRLDRAQSGDFSEFFKSPGFEFVRDEGTRGIENTFSAKGSGGNALRALAEFNSGLASQEFGNFFNRDLSLAGIGSQGINTSANIGSATSANISNNLIGTGNVRASGIAGQNSAIQGTLGNLINLNAGRNPNALGFFKKRSVDKSLEPIFNDKSLF